MGDRGVLPGAQERLYGPGAATGNGRTLRELFDAVPDRGVACPVRHATGPRLPGNALRDGIRARGMAIGVPYLERQACDHDAKPGRDSDHDRRAGRLLESRTRWACRTPDDLDRHATCPRLRPRLVGLRSPGPAVSCV